MQNTQKSSNHLLLSAILLFLFLNLSESTITCHPNDKKALLQIKAHLGGESASPFSNWDPKTDCCRWNNIGCDDQDGAHPGRVTSLVINSVDDVVGQLPPAVGDLPYLISLRFLYLPNFTGPIPTTIARLTKLQVLEFGSNNMDGHIPDFFGNLKDLESVLLYSNKFSGPIPSSLSLLSKLTELDLFQNKLSGPIPESFGSFKSELGLQLFDNQLSGPIPKSLGNAKLRSIDVSNNNLIGDASFFFRSDKPLMSIGLKNNKFKFDFSNVDLPQGLKDLDIAHNMIYGSLPKQIGQLPLQSIDVSYNQLCGMIPTGRRLKRFKPSFFAHNKCLCGAPLPPCK